MKKNYIFILLALSFLNAQTHIAPAASSGFTVSFMHDQNVDFFGEGKFIKDSYGNGISVGYIYNGTLGIDLMHSYSFYNRSKTYIFDVEDGLADENFNFVENFRTENEDLGDKSFSLGLTYYLNENQNIFQGSLPLNFSIGLRYGSTSYSSDALNYLNQDFYGKFYAIEFGIFKEIETSADFYMIPRIKVSLSKEKNIYDLLEVENIEGLADALGTKSFNMSSTYFELAIPFILNRTSAGQPFVEPSISNNYGTTHLGLKFGLLL